MIIKEWRCAILHENNVFKTLMLLKLQDYKIPQHIMELLSCDKQVWIQYAVISSKQVQFIDKDVPKTTPLSYFF